MHKAQVVTIGTEITSGEVINTNAAWVGQRLESHGVRVFSHLSVRDQREEILKGLNTGAGHEWIVVTGGLGPTSDDITRACMAEYCGRELEFDPEIWLDMQRMYSERGLPLREAHKLQCWFPSGARRLRNPVGSALGFALDFEDRHYFVLPGPPRELEGMWNLEVEPDLARLSLQHGFSWRRWTCLGSPESEIAEMVEKCIAGSGLEVGYRAAVPYVKVKLYVDAADMEHQRRADAVTRVLAPFLVGDGQVDLAEELLRLWPLKVLQVCDSLCEKYLVQRLYEARAAMVKQGAEPPELEFYLQPRTRPDFSEGLAVEASGENFTVTMIAGENFVREVKSLPYKLKLSSERGRLSAAEWAIWSCVKALRA